MKNLLAFALVILFVSCSSKKDPNTGVTSSRYDHGHGLSAAAGVGAGALAWNLTDNKSKDAQLAWTSGAALTTFALGEYVRSENLLSLEQKYALGYKAGQGDAVKLHYEMLQNLQRASRGAVAKRYSTYSFPGLENREGVNLAPHTIKLRVQE